ncbi:MAG: serine protease [Verrucomicrobia bacterium]|nr:serine protease [Verrucomicrobiota bacterium]
MKMRLVIVALACGLVLAGTGRAAEKDKAADLVRDYRSGLVFFEGKAGMGSGFITDIKGRKFLITNAHVVAGIKAAKFKLLDRTDVQVGAASVAVGHDLIALTVVGGGTAIPTVASLDKEAEIGDAVVVLGNAEGAGVVNLLEGKLTGIGPNLVEVDAPFVPGNSGSPIIHVSSGKVVGVDSVQQWQTIDWKQFYVEADAIERVKKTTGEFVDLLNDLGRHGRPTHSYDSPVIRSALETFYMSRGLRPGMRNAAGSGQSLPALLHTASRNDLADAKARCTYDFFRRQLEEEERNRGEILGVFDKMLKGRR